MYISINHADIVTYIVLCMRSYIYIYSICTAENLPDHVISNVNAMRKHTNGKMKIKKDVSIITIIHNYNYRFIKPNPAICKRH